MTSAQEIKRFIVADSTRIQTFGEAMEHPYMVSFGVRMESHVIYWRMPSHVPSNDEPSPIWIVARKVATGSYEWSSNLHGVAYEKLLEHFGLNKQRPNISYIEAQHLPPIYFAQLRRTLDRRYNVPPAVVRNIRSIDKQYPISAMFCC